MFLSLFSVSPPYRQAMLKDNLLGRLHQLLKPQVKNSSFLAATTKNRKKKAGKWQGPALYIEFMGKELGRG